jgi:peptide/nickel transport system substrate-binding protein
MGEDGKPLPYLDELVFKVVPEGATRLMMLKGGQIDVDMAPDMKDAAALLDDPNYTVLHGGGHLVIQVDMNTRVPPFDDLRVRQALSYAIDRQEIVDALFYGFADAPSDFFPPRAISAAWLHDPGYPA